MKFITFLIFSALVFNANAASNTRYEIFTFGEKPQLSLPTKNNLIDLEMARNEYEIWSLVFPKNSSADIISKVEIKWKEKPPAVELQTYWLAVQNFKSSSYRSGFQAGEIADIPVPLEWIEKKSIQIPKANTPNKAQFLFELFTLPQATAGTYTGDLSFTIGTKKVLIPIHLKIHDVTLPEKFELATSFGFAPWEVLRKHYGAWHKDEMILYQQYESLALEHRIDLHKLYIKFPEKTAKDPLIEAPVAAQSFLGQTNKLFAGTLHDKKFTMSMTDLPVEQEYKSIKADKNLSLDKKERFWKNLNASVLKNNLTNKTFIYFVDEPKTAELEELGKNLRQIRKWAPDLKFLVTTTYHDTLEGAINLWCLNLILWDKPTEKSPDFYLKRKSQNKEDFWFYVGCNSHGCDGTENIENPDLVTDRPSAYQRVFPWMALKYEASGILYYDTVYGYSKGSLDTPWTDAFHFTGYGEGTLFYPCTPQLGHCKTQRVIASLRLKILRDGLEDVQILKMAQKKDVQNKSLVNKIKNVRSFPKNTEDFEQLKRQALNALDKK